MNLIVTKLIVEISLLSTYQYLPTTIINHNINTMIWLSNSGIQTSLV